MKGALIGVPLTATNYLGIFSGVNDGENGAGTYAPTARAAFLIGKGTPLTAISDGTSNTILMAEYLTGLDDPDARGTFYTTRAGSQFLYMTLGPNSKSPDNLLRHDQFCPDSGARNKPLQNLPCTPGDTPANYASSRSRHSGGVSVVLGDGSVRFIQDSVDGNTWQRLGWIADGQVLGDF